MSSPYSPDSIPLCLQGRTVALLASGPSLTPKQVWQASRAGWALAGCNDQAIYALDVLYAPDHDWIDTIEPRVGHIPHRWTTLTKVQRSPRNPAVIRPDWCYVDTDPNIGYSYDPKVLARGRHAGYQLINLVAQMGALRLVLLGYDCHKAPDQPRHWFGRHPGRFEVESDYEGWAPLYRSLVEPLRNEGVEVINATPHSAIDAFPRADLDELV